MADYRRCSDLPGFQIVNALRGYENKYNGTRAELTRVRGLYDQLVRTHEDTEAQNEVLQRVQEQNKVEMEQVRQALLEMEVEQRLTQQRRNRYDSDSGSDSCSSSDYSSEEDRRRCRRRSSAARSGSIRSGSIRSGTGSNRSAQSPTAGSTAHSSPQSADAQSSRPPVTPTSAPMQSPPTDGAASRQQMPATVSTVTAASPASSQASKPPSPLLTPEKLGMSAAQYQAMTSSQKTSPESKWHRRETTNANS